MDILFKKGLTQLLFWIYDFIDTIGQIFNILVGTQKVEEGANGRSLLEVLIESTVSTKVLLSLVLISVIIAGACMGVRIAKNVFKLKSGGEHTPTVTIIGQNVFAVLSSVACIFFVTLFIAFVSMLLNMVNGALGDGNNLSLGRNLFNMSVEQTYVIDENKPTIEVTGDYFYDNNGNKVQDTNPDGSPKYDENNDPVWKMEIIEVINYEKDEVTGEYIMESGWRNGNTAEDLKWNMNMNNVFGVHKKSAFGLFEDKDRPYSIQPMVELSSLNLFTAYLVAVVMVISMFLLCVGLVKRIYDIVVLLICMPLVCGTIPLDDGARFRAWRETLMSKLIVAFGAVIAINVFYMIGGYITGGGFAALVARMVGAGVLSNAAGTIFQMVMLLGGALCINGSMTLIARILGTSADESREAMQALGTLVSGVRMGVGGLVTAGRLGGSGWRFMFGGRNRYGRETTGMVNYGARIGNKIGEKIGGEKYADSRGGKFVRKLGRMDPGYQYKAKNHKQNEFSQPEQIPQPQQFSGRQSVANSASSALSGLGNQNGGMQASSSGKKGGAFKRSK